MRSTPNSPLQSLATPNSLVSTALSNASGEDLRRRHYDDFGESDDELRREDILFATDTGKNLCIFIYFDKILAFPIPINFNAECKFLFK